ncbi:MAG TPA: choice-of-anchor Q domain-containing protein [Steroidobacteraceae bacterium]|nr:choice-of-anchor Q domain-containing protein [Steroidobacteraceae bacterium]
MLISHSVLIGNQGVIGGHGDGGSNLGGGIYVGGGRLIVVGSTITQNLIGDLTFSQSSADGAGIYNLAGKVWLLDSAVVGNFENGLGYGGGIYNASEMHIENSTIAGNTTATSGGGIANFGDLTLQGVTVVDSVAEGSGRNDLSGPPFPPTCIFPDGDCTTGGCGIWSDAGTVRIADTLIAGNQRDDYLGVLLTEGHNALGSSADCTLQPAPHSGHEADTDLTNLDPMIGALTDNGKPGNPHFPLLPDSPLIDAGGRVDVDCTPFDQIGEPRVDARVHEHGTRCDVGAIEYQPPR